jgi:hypothetical protein
VATHPELSAGAPDDHHVLDDQGSYGRALAGPHIAVHLVPHGGAGRGVECEHVRVQGGDEHHAVRHCAPPVDVAAAQRHVVRGRMLVAPELIPVAGVERPHPAIPAGDVHDAVDDERGGLERVRRRTGVHADRAGLEDPSGNQALDVVDVDLVERAVPLPVIGPVVGDPVVRLGIAGLQNAIVVDAFDDGRRLAGKIAQSPEVDGVPCVYVLLSCHQLLLSTVVAGAGGRAWPRVACPPRRRSLRSGRGPRRSRWSIHTSSSRGRPVRVWPFPSNGSPAR